MEDMPSAKKRITKNIATPYMETINKLISKRLKPKIIFERISKEGYSGSVRFLRYVINNHCGIKKPDIKARQDKIGKTQLSSILWKKEDTLTDNQKKLCREFVNTDETLNRVREFVQQFRTAIESKNTCLLVEWLDRVEAEKNECFYETAKKMKADLDAIKNALIYPYSNGILEGNINRLKAIKRQMYGRAKFDLLRKKVLYQLD